MKALWSAVTWPERKWRTRRRERRIAAFDQYLAAMAATTESLEWDFRAMGPRLHELARIVTVSRADIEAVQRTADAMLPELRETIRKARGEAQ